MNSCPKTIQQRPKPGAQKSINRSWRSCQHGQKTYTKFPVQQTTIIVTLHNTKTQTFCLLTYKGYYAPKLGRWLSEDPARADGYNWYVYCVNNPVIYIDTSGNVIQLVGTEEEQEAILVNLQKLTDHTIAIDGNGVVNISSFAEESDVKYASGNELITRLIDTAFTTEICVGTNGNTASAIDITNASNGTGSDTRIEFNPEADPGIMTVNRYSGDVFKAKRPAHIGLSHELIHADHNAQGSRILGKQSYTYQTGKQYIKVGASYVLSVSTQTQFVNSRELRTVGLAEVRPGDITENDIRAEQGLQPRGAY